MRTINLTQHKSTPEQQKTGVEDIRSDLQPTLIELLTFEEVPCETEIQERVAAIACLVSWHILNVEPSSLDQDDMVVALGMDLISDKTILQEDCQLMIGGAPFLMAPLQEELSFIGEVVYAFSKRVTEEVQNPDGSVSKKSTFRHEGFVSAVFL